MGTSGRLLWNFQENLIRPKFQNFFAGHPVYGFYFVWGSGGWYSISRNGGDVQIECSSHFEIGTKQEIHIKRTMQKSNAPNFFVLIFNIGENYYKRCKIKSLKFVVMALFMFQYLWPPRPRILGPYPLDFIFLRSNSTTEFSYRVKWTRISFNGAVIRTNNSHECSWKCYDRKKKLKW